MNNIEPITQMRRIMHDLISPLIAVKVITDNCQHIPDKDRELLQNATERLFTIVNSFEQECSNWNLIDVNLAINKIFAEKQALFQVHEISFLHYVWNKQYDIKIRGDKGDFERMLSNIVNNGVEAILACNDNRVGTITATADLLAQNVTITIMDNGNGISDEVLTKLRNKIPVTYGKSNGHGIGFTQITDTVAKMNGTLKIESRGKNGAVIVMTFPAANANH